MTTSIIEPVRRLVPRPLKRAVKDVMLDLTFRRAVRQIRDVAPGATPTRETLNELIVGWGNEGFAAQVDYLEEVSRHAAKTPGPILECGSGLTTIVLGLLAGLLTPAQPAELSRANARSTTRRFIEGFMAGLMDAAPQHRGRSGR